MSHVRVSSILLLLSVTATVATAAEFRQQTITIPSDQGWWVAVHRADVDGDGLTDLFALLPAQRELRVYRQRRSGFAPTPDQIVALPDQTAWIAMRDVDPHAGGELLISTAAGLVYLRQNGGVFEPSPQTLIEARQVFAADRLRVATNPPGAKDAGDVIPVLFEDHAALYEKGDDGVWRVARTVDLTPKETTWQARREHWMAGSTPAFSLEVRQTVRARPQEDPVQDQDDENKIVQELTDKIARNAPRRDHEVEHQDVNGDGREDVVVWRAQGDVNPTVTIVLLLRGPDGKLPTTPTRVLRHSGLPIGVDRKLGVSPFRDLDGDGRCELILVALKTRVTSWSGLVDLTVSGGLDWFFTVRSGREGDYAGGPDFQMNVTSMTPRDGGVLQFFRLDGDFNGDGREDLLIHRGPERFDVYLSDTRTGFFQAGPALSFAAPVEVREVDTADLNGDGISDLFAQEMLEARIIVHLSQSEPRKGASQ